VAASEPQDYVNFHAAALIWSQTEIGVDVPLAVELDRSSLVPLYSQLAQAIEAAIRDGDLAPGDRFENELALAKRLTLSRLTTRQAIQQLVDKGLLVRKRGVGTQVVQNPVLRHLRPARRSWERCLSRSRMGPARLRAGWTRAHWLCCAAPGPPSPRSIRTAGRSHEPCSDATRSPP
jgi:DNA-binding transcriptional regulator YhcF (GntR family)